LEFKTGTQKPGRGAFDQVEDYALDLRDFHTGSTGLVIVPVVLCRQPPAGFPLGANVASESADAVLPPVACGYPELAALILSRENSECADAFKINAVEWDAAAYKPVPTILEAAEALFANHDVRDIAEASADKQNLSATSDFLLSVVEQAKELRQKVVCVLTGVPGAGKTLAGLNLAHNPTIRSSGLPNAVFLSGNGPLVRVVSAALSSSSISPKGAAREVGTFIQNVHSYIRDGLRSDVPPHEAVVIFDEAQRAWDAKRVSLKLSQWRSQGQDVLSSDFETMSEPEMLLRVMDKHKDWAVLVALVGGGQEIHDGEAGLEEWGRAIQVSFPHWRIAASPAVLPTGAGLSGHRLFHGEIPPACHLEVAPTLHLGVSVRSFRAESLSSWVDAVLNGEEESARTISRTLENYPIVLSRDLREARRWLHGRRRGERRAGLLASAGALRLRADGIELSPGFRGNKGQYENWFLKPDGDCRSSNQLEIAASQFECQGLEIDWGGICWGEDFLWQPSHGWCYSRLNGSSRGRVPREHKQRYIRNGYRVLLTRAREGMVIYVPNGNLNDPTRPEELFESTADYLARCGVMPLH
jgi:hypothetical protein